MLRKASEVGMNDRRKIIKGLECCSAMSGEKCRECPYNDECYDTNLPYGISHLCANTLELLKEQEVVKPVKQIEQTEWIVCSNCRNHIISKWIFCPYCGRPVEWE